MTTDELYAAHRAAGRCHAIVEALAENDVTVADATHLSRRDIMDHVLTWNGIIGYTDLILEAADELAK